MILKATRLIPFRQSIYPEIACLLIVGRDENNEMEDHLAENVTDHPETVNYRVHQKQKQINNHKSLLYYFPIHRLLILKSI